MSLNITKGADISPYIDHTALKPGLLLKDVEKLCGEAKTYGFAAVCIPPLFVKHAKEFCTGSSVKVATVIGFPFGYCSVEAKIAEILLAMVDGADELDVVINFTAIKNNDWQLVANEINHIMPIVKSKGKIIKTIIESGVLTDEEIIRCCDIYGAAGIDFMKTSTGYADKGASVEAVKLMRKHLPESISIKASGGIRTFEFARELIAAGATRLGCSSSIAIVQEKTAEGNY
ncbi:MAG: deoxyribose-phosphate aldolase [Chitinophagaceae bacterium]|jgi:deoxyribose-phosphate aldolase|nr:deoxyribose-phosphate aldolase [Chitinophagaceae bacterium]